MGPSSSVKSRGYGKITKDISKQNNVYYNQNIIGTNLTKEQDKLELGVNLVGGL